MSNKNKRRKGKPQAPAGPEQNSSPATAPVPIVGVAPNAGAMVLPIVFLLLAAGSAFALVWEHLGGMQLPGCGEGGACEQAAESFFGAIRVGGFEWPVSYLGLAYFLGALAVWLVCRGMVPRAFLYLVRLGALSALFFVVVIFFEQLFCPYCIASHIGNFAFWITLEIIGARGRAKGPAVASLVGVFIVSSIGVGIWDAQHRAAAEEHAEAQLGESVQQLVEQTQAPDEQDDGVAHVDDGAPDTDGTGESTAPDSDPADSGDSQGFAGRYRWGPEKAPIRIVMITDYQCPDCYKMEKQLVELMKERDDMAVWIKHFPFCTMCNPHVSKTLHPNACWAARAAEAAGILWGAEGFWKMHQWLFEHRGAFRTTAVLLDGVRSLGYEPGNFVQLIQSPATLAPVEADMQEAVDLGLHFTPLVFINGVELKGWSAPNALRRAVEAVAATNPPALPPTADKPPTAIEKYINDWRRSPERRIAPDSDSHPLGPAEADAAVTIVLWGDLHEPYSKRADRIARALVAERGDVHYEFRLYPFNSACNEYIPDARHPHACEAARAAIAAGQLSGDEAYWKMHEWVADHVDDFSVASLRAAATEMGLDPDALVAKMESPEVEAALQEDIRAGKLTGLRSVPWFMIEGRWVPRWLKQGDSIIDEIVAAVADDK
jgi:protein-disulfide isomerase/uncharacterized membrane protein